MLNNDGTVQNFDNDYKGPIMMWPFQEAPVALRKLRSSGGQWLAHFPPWFSSMALPMASQGLFEKADMYEIADGSIVLISHKE